MMSGINEDLLFKGWIVREEWGEYEYGCLDPHNSFRILYWTSEKEAERIESAHRKDSEE